MHSPIVKTVTSCQEVQREHILMESRTCGEEERFANDLILQRNKVTGLIINEI
jgi:hypothetical protein